MSADIIESHGSKKEERLVMLITTQACNCACQYCYETHKSNAKMSVATAKQILTSEFETAGSKGVTRLNIDFMGGEPLLQFELIREVCEWLWSQEWPLDYSVMARTNGLLLNDEMRCWFATNSNRFSLGLSMDGLPSMHRINRSAVIPEADFFLLHWPDQPIRMTLFPDSIHLLAESVIAFHEKGIPFTVSFGEGFVWGKQAEDEFERQLHTLVSYYITHSEIPPAAPLLHNKYLNCFPEDSLKTFTSNICFDATRIATYDCDGSEYRCHLFSPVCMGKERAERAMREVTRLDCLSPDPECLDCPARFVCKRCFGLDYKTFGNLRYSANRIFLCRMQRISLKASADICLGRLAALQQQRPLTTEEMRSGVLALKVSDTFASHS